MLSLSQDKAGKPTQQEDVQNTLNAIGLTKIQINKLILYQFVQLKLDRIDENDENDESKEGKARIQQALSKLSLPKNKAGRLILQESTQMKSVICLLRERAFSLRKNAFSKCYLSFIQQMQTQ